MTPTRIDIGWKLTCQTPGCAGTPGTDCTLLTGPNAGKPRGTRYGLHAGRLKAADEALGIWASRQAEIDALATQVKTLEDGADFDDQRIDTLEARIANTTSQLNNQAAELTTAQEALGIARNNTTVDAATISGLRDQVKALQGRFDALTREYAEYRAARPPVVTPPVEAGWTPAKITSPPRPDGVDYVRIEDIPGAGSDLRFATAHQMADGKKLTLPPGAITLKDFIQGESKFMHGLMVNAAVGRYHCRGIVGSGPDTSISMAPMSSHFTETSGRQGTEATTQQVQNTILFYGIPDVEFGNLTLQGAPQPHFHHGFRSTGDRTHVHHLKTMGAAQSGANMPPGETYSCAVGGKDAVIEDCDFDGRRTVGGPPVSSTVVATLAATNPTIRRCHMHDLVSGFGIVQWEGVGLTTEDVWVTRPGTSTGGWNGAHTNHEKGAGPIRHIRPHVTLDGWWGKPQRNKSKFPHFIFLRPDNTEDYADTQIIEPVFDQWGATKGGFAIMLDDVAAKVSTKPKVVINGKTLTGVVRPKWWVESPAIDTATQYWITANNGDGSVWG